LGAIEEIDRPPVGRLEQKHGLPLRSMPGVAYVIHYGEPVTARLSEPSATDGRALDDERR
jgi:hypothetical protein